MGLRETALQNGVILLGLFLAELSSGIGEPWTWTASNRQMTSTAKSLRCHILIEGGI